MVTAWRKPLWLVVACFFFFFIWFSLLCASAFDFPFIRFLGWPTASAIYYIILPLLPVCCTFQKSHFCGFARRLFGRGGCWLSFKFQCPSVSGREQTPFFPLALLLSFDFKLNFILKKKSHHVTWCVPSARFLEVPSDLLKLFQICLCVIWWKNRIYNVPPGLFAPLPVLEVSPARPGFSFSSFVPIEILLQFQEVGPCVRCHFPFDSLKTGNLSPAEMWRW